MKTRSMTRKQRPEASASGARERITSPPTLEQVTELLDQLKELTRSNIESRYRHQVRGYFYR